MGTGICWTGIAKVLVPSPTVSSEVKRLFNGKSSVNTSNFENPTLKILCMLAAVLGQLRSPEASAQLLFPICSDH